MRYNLASVKETNQAFEYLTKLGEKEAVVEVKRINPKRSNPQKRYLHLIIAAFGMHFGYDLEEAKQVYKELNASIYAYKKKGRVFWRSSASLDKETMAKTIDKFMRKSAEAGCSLPLAENEDWLNLIANEAERNHYI